MLNLHQAQSSVSENLEPILLLVFDLFYSISVKVVESQCVATASELFSPNSFSALEKDVLLGLGQWLIYLFC